MDITETLAPVSDQLDAVDLVGAPRVFTIERVTKGSSEQPVNVFLAEFPRPWRPGRNMRRVLGNVWGTDASKWAGNRIKLWCDPNVRYGGSAVGGVRILAMSGIDKPTGTPTIITRGKSAIYTVDPLPNQTVDEQVAALRAEWHTANEERRAALTAEVQRLQGGAS